MPQSIETYRKYSTQDFEKDSYFRRWVCHPDESTDKFWEEFLQACPEKAIELSEARKKILRYYELVKPEEGDSKRQSDNWQAILYKREQMRAQKKRNNRKIAISVFGAASIFVILFQLYFYYSPKQENTPPKITLQLQDGSEQVIVESDTRTITTATGQHLGSQQQHILIYDHIENATELVYNELKVPYGKTFELVLSDGSHIYLNAGSSLRYPVQFLPEQPRDVFLNGEAFFEVAKDEQRPFTVITDEMNTQVYGTKFNVTSYKNEENTYTVLVEGSVGVYPSADDKLQNSPLKITPGQRAVFEKGKIAVEEVEIRKYTAWTKGELYFLNDPFGLIMKKLERHYNITINNNYPQVNQERLTSSFKRGDSLELVLSILDKIEAFNYQIDGNTLTITAPD